jgi:hypothetical protein
LRPRPGSTRVVRLSIDELVFERHGRHGIHYDESEYPAITPLPSKNSTNISVS